MGIAIVILIFIIILCLFGLAGADENDDISKAVLMIVIIIFLGILSLVINERGEKKAYINSLNGIQLYEKHYVIDTQETKTDSLYVLKNKL